MSYPILQQNFPTGLEPALLRLVAAVVGNAPFRGRFQRRDVVAQTRSLTGTDVPADRLMRALNQVRAVRRYLGTRLRSVEANRAGSWFEYSLSDDLLAARRQGEPILFLFWHAGIIAGVFPAISVIAPDIKLIKSGKVFREESSGLGVFETAEDTDDRSFGNAKVLKGAISHLRNGGAVGTFIDGTNGQSAMEVSFFGRRIFARRGTALLGRSTGAAVFPCVCRWDSQRGRLRFVVGERIHYPRALTSRGPAETQAQERAFLQSAVGWFERHLRRHPEDLTQSALNILEQAGAMANE